MELKIKKAEVLRYLGYKGTDIPEQLDKLINKVMIHSKTLIVPRYIYKRYKLDKTDKYIGISDTNIRLIGQDIKEHLADSHEVYLLSATVGLNFDQFIRKIMITSPEEGVIYNSCGNCYVEAIADYATTLIDTAISVEGLVTKWRFSAGYGDLPLDSQPDFVKALDCYRKIGVSVSDSLLLIPSKSITAILPIIKL